MRTTRFRRALAREGAGRRGDARWETREPARLTAISPVRRHEVWRRDVGSGDDGAKNRLSASAPARFEILRALHSPRATCANVHAVARFIEAHGDDPIARHQPWRGALPRRTLPEPALTTLNAPSPRHGQDKNQHDSSGQLPRSTGPGCHAPGAADRAEGDRGASQGAQRRRRSPRTRASRGDTRAAGREDGRRDEAQGGDAASGEAAQTRGERREALRRGRARRQPARGKTPQDRGEGGREGGAAGGPQGQVPRPTRQHRATIRQADTPGRVVDRRRDSNRRRPRASLEAPPSR